LKITSVGIATNIVLPAELWPSDVERLAIRPYPRELEERISRNERPVLLRPIRPEDDPQHAEFLAKLTAEDMRYRFFNTVRPCSPLPARAPDPDGI
jgi:acetyltransferase